MKKGYMYFDKENIFYIAHNRSGWRGNKAIHYDELIMELTLSFGQSPIIKPLSDIKNKRHIKCIRILRLLSL